MKKTGSQPASAAHVTNHSAPRASAQPAPSHRGFARSDSLRPQREDGARQMAQPRQQDAGIEDGDVDIRIAVGDEVPHRAGQAPQDHPALQQQQPRRA